VSVLLTLFVFSFVAGWGNTEFLIRAYGKHPARIYQIFLSSVFTRSAFLLLTPILFFIYPFHIAIIVVPLICVQFLSESMNSLVVYHHKFKAHILAELVVFLIILLALFSLDSFSASYFLLFYLIANLAKAGILILAIKPFSQGVSLKFNVKLIVAMAPFFVIVLSGWMHSRIDLYIIDFFRSPSELSQYQILATIVSSSNDRIVSACLRTTSMRMYGVPSLEMSSPKMMMPACSTSSVARSFTLVGSAMMA